MSYWIILQSQWNLFLQQAATYVFPEAAHKVMPHKENKKGLNSCFHYLNAF